MKEPAFHPKIVTTISISKYAWLWLKRKGLDEAWEEGTQPSASAVIEKLVRRAAEAEPLDT